MHNFNHTTWAPTIVINGVITPLKLPYKWGTVFFSPLLSGSHFAEILQIFQAKPSNR